MLLSGFGASLAGGEFLPLDLADVDRLGEGFANPMSYPTRAGPYLTGAIYTCSRRIYLMGEQFLGGGLLRECPGDGILGRSSFLFLEFQSVMVRRSAHALEFAMQFINALAPLFIF